MILIEVHDTQPPPKIEENNQTSLVSVALYLQVCEWGSGFGFVHTPNIINDYHEQ